MKIAEQVRRSLPGMIAYCEAQDPAEFGRLCDPRWSKASFDINYPFWRRVETITADKSCRYWQTVWQVNGLAVRVTSQWFNPPTSRSQPLLAQYLSARGLTLASADTPPLSLLKAQDARPAMRIRRGRYRSPAIGNAQNGLIRNILGRLGQDSFGEFEWPQVMAQFDHLCAYCGSGGPLQQDHVVPINRTALGEHRLGNLVPCCPSCNAAKHNRDFRAFLSAAPDRVAQIEAHMVRHGYRPMGRNPRVQQVFEEAHAEMRLLADRYARIVEAVLSEETRA